MYIEIEHHLTDTGEISLVCDTNNNSSSRITLRLANAEGQVVVECIEPHKLGQFIVNAKRILTMAHEDEMLSSEGDDEDDSECDE